MTHFTVVERVSAARGVAAVASRRHGSGRLTAVVGGAAGGTSLVSQLALVGRDEHGGHRAGMRSVPLTEPADAA